uniref:Uncharacterized protein n=1 Tax=Neogobius melanostomus TaxID=47308 RepID=A0A8C6TAJ1_9GOBI
VFAPPRLQRGPAPSPGRTQGSPAPSDPPSRGKPPLPSHPRRGPPPPPPAPHTATGHPLRLTLICFVSDDFEAKYSFHPLDDFPPQKNTDTSLRLPEQANRALPAT